MFEVYLVILVITLVIGGVAISLGLYAIHQKSKKKVKKNSNYW